jgi:nucleotide-binding universal stress UspA family protein
MFLSITRHHPSYWDRMRQRNDTNAPSIFSRTLVGVDGTEPAFEACRQAGRLAEPDAAIDVVAVVHLADSLAAGVDSPHGPDQLRIEAEEALDKAVAILGQRAQKRFANGFITEALLSEVRRAHSTLLALGSHGHRRMTEILIGGVAGELLHQSACSVLIARPGAGPNSFPRSLVVGMDGSHEADTALKVARQLAGRFGSGVRIITALQDEDIDLARIHLRAPSAEALDQHPVEALVGASEEADLLIVGSRGLRGVRALGSVSERVAHQANCSVLVVRAPVPVRRSTFTPAEWQLLCEAPTHAGLIVATAQSGGFFWEALSIARTYTEVRAEQGHSNPLLNDIVAGRPLVDHTRFRSIQAFREHGLAHIRAAIELLEKKAQPADVDAFARFVLGVAEHVAGAYPQSDEAVSEAEERALSDVRMALGLKQDAELDR